MTSFASLTPNDGVCSTTVALAANNSCILSVGSPFLLTSDGTSTSLVFTALGLATDAGNSSTSTYVGFFTEQVPITTAQIAAAIDAGGSLTNTYSATLVVGATSALEPSTLALMLSGVGLVFAMRKRIGQRLPQAS